MYAVFKIYFVCLDGKPVMYEKSFMENIAEQTLNGAKSDEKAKVITGIHELQSKNLKTKLM